MVLQKLNMQSIRIGASADIQIRIETGEVVFAPISSISRSAPARVVTQAATWSARRLAGILSSIPKG